MMDDEIPVYEAPRVEPEADPDTLPRRGEQGRDGDGG